LALVLAAAPTAHAWPRPRVHLGGEIGSASFSNIVEFERFATSPDRPERVEAQFDGTTLRGFAIGLDLHEDLALDWRRSSGSSRYRYWIDGEEVKEGLVDGIDVQLGDVDLRVDTITFRYHPQRWRWKGIGPSAAFGIGWILQSQQENFRPPRSLSLDWSDSDDLLEFALGVEGRWHFASAGFELRSLHWRFEPDDGSAPRETVRAWIPTFQVTVGF
jgi:hypothetical protein